MSGRPTPDYGLDSPAIVRTQLIIAGLAISLALFKPSVFGLHVRWIEAAIGAYFLHGALSMIEYSRRGKRALRDRLLDLLRWRGDESVLDVGCGKGLLLIGAAKRLTTGRAVGVDLWLPHAMTGNQPEAAMRNAGIEGVADRVHLLKGDVRTLPARTGAFDVVLSNFVVHEVDSSADREALLQEMVRVLKPGGRLALVDFIFTKECVEILRRSGAEDVTRSRIGGFRHWLGAILMLGTFQLCAVTATAPPALPLDGATG